MRLPLIPSNDPVLRTKAKRISDPTAVAELATDMVETMQAEGGVGLAAPQIGKSIRLFVTNVGHQPHVFINPHLSGHSEEQIWWEEGCLSLPRLFGQVKRPKQVTLSAVDERGKGFSVKADNLFARALQHELDHLDGVLFTDRMEDLSTLRKVTVEEWNSRFESSVSADSTREPI